MLSITHPRHVEPAALEHSDGYWGAECSPGSSLERTGHLFRVFAAKAARAPGCSLGSRSSLRATAGPGGAGPSAARPITIAVLHISAPTFLRSTWRRCRRKQKMIMTMSASWCRSARRRPTSLRSVTRAPTKQQQLNDERLLTWPQPCLYPVAIVTCGIGSTCRPGEGVPADRQAYRPSPSASP